MLLKSALSMDIKVEHPGHNGATDLSKNLGSAASTINMIANKLASSKAQNQTSASEKITKLSLALSSKTSTVGANSSTGGLISQSLAQLSVLKSQTPGGSTIAIVSSPPSATQNQVSLLASQPLKIVTTSQTPHNVVSKMTEVLSLKQSPTLTKQLTTPISGTTSKVQVITAYMCRYCGQQFDSPSAMQLHIQNHVNGKTPHQCSVCGKEYRTPSKLQRHVRVHSGERPYACTICGRRFTRSDHVKQHMKVHLQVKDLNTCRLCNDMRFNRRQTLHLHLQQIHLIGQVFTCHRCGEAYESLEEMQTHKLEHDAVLNSLKDDGQRSLDAPLGVAKFALGPQKVDTISKFVSIKTEPDVQSKTISILDKIESNGLYIPANLDNVSSVGNKAILEGMAKEAINLEIQKKYEEELLKMKDDEGSPNAQLSEEERKKLLQDQLKIAECFRIKSDRTDGSKNQDVEMGGNTDDEDDDDANKQATTVVSDDGMSMFILPSTIEEGDIESKFDEDDDDDDDDDMDGLTIALDQNSSKESGIGEENEDGPERMEESGSNDIDGRDRYISVEDNRNSSKSETSTGRYSRPCPKSKKPGNVMESNNNKTETINGTDYKTETQITGVRTTRRVTSLLNSKLTELMKAKAGQNDSSNSNGSKIPMVVSDSNSYARILPNNLSTAPKLTLMSSSSSSGVLSTSALQNYFLPISSGNVVLSNHATKAAVAPTQLRVVPSPSTKPKPDTSKLIRCEHCCIWFEDNAMSLLHNTLHAADEADPFTCRKCLKRLGNRLEFMAHLVWHLEPNMDI